MIKANLEWRRKNLNLVNYVAILSCGEISFTARNSYKIIIGIKRVDESEITMIVK